MKIIQFLIIGSLGLGFYTYFSFFKSNTRNRSLMLLMGALGAVFALFPDFLSDVARILGVGRGTDLLFYFSLVCGFFVILVLYSKISKLERDQVELTRSIALKLAKRMDEPTKTP